MNNTILSSVTGKDNKEQSWASLVDLFHYLFYYHYYTLENYTTFVQLMSAI